MGILFIAIPSPGIERKAEVEESLRFVGKRWGGGDGWGGLDGFDEM